MKVPKYQLIECKVTTPVIGTLQSRFFDQQPQIQSIGGDKKVYIKAIEAYTGDIMANSPLSPQNVTMLAADISNSMLVLIVEGVADFKQIPLSRLLPIQGTTAPNVWAPFMLRNVYAIDWSKSYVQMVNAPVTPVPFSFLFGVVYDYVPDEFDVEVGYETIHQ